MKHIQQHLNSPEQRRVPEQPPPPPAPVYVPPPPPPVPPTNYNNLPFDLVQQLENLPVLVEPGSRCGRPRRTIPAPALPDLVQPVRCGRPKKAISAPGPAPGPALLPAIPLPDLAPASAILTSAQLAAQYAALPPDPLENVRHGRPRRTTPAPAPAPIQFEELAAQHAALPPVCFFFFF